MKTIFAVLLIGILTSFNAIPAKVYRAHCYDDSHGLRKVWCGPERDTYQKASDDAKEHKKLGNNHDENVCDGSSGISGTCSDCPS